MSLHDIQRKVRAAKGKRNEFGKYNYRTAEGIMAEAKAAMPDGWYITCSDSITEAGAHLFVTAHAIIHDETGKMIAHAIGHAMHPEQKKGMDPSQITGAASSYARKYALAGLFAVDDGSVDPDATNNAPDAAGSLSPNLQAWEDGILDSLPPDPSEETLAEAYADTMIHEVGSYRSSRGLGLYIRRHKPHGEFINHHAPERAQELKARIKAKMAELEATE